MGFNRIEEYKWDEAGIETARKKSNDRLPPHGFHRPLLHEGNGQNLGRRRARKGKKSGPDLTTTRLDEVIQLKLAVAGKNKLLVFKQATQATLVPGGKRISCRVCQAANPPQDVPTKIPWEAIWEAMPFRLSPFSPQNIPI
ncbi:hypothetical protein PtA15_6A813 [Puccinia triticina]|uniref:Uncharacterized protein n=1 Tax=Puccinia triticina TaxID=208348 RepID=A0ABY7CLS2_9BASI|nr:uncharacterized protein PtA15_6A813 [Puccinia triticina]WAQ86181.1 hypothetical protein PtA15_6A813 [Puccinia triticina]